MASGGRPPAPVPGYEYMPTMNDMLMNYYAYFAVRLLWFDSD